MSKSTLKLVVFLLCLLTAPGGSSAHGAALQEEQMLARLAGSWSGEAQHLGKNARLQMMWERVLEGKFARLSLRVEPASAGQAFEGHAYYRRTDAGRYSGSWFDSFGNAFQIRGEQEGDTLTAFWGEPGKEEGRSTYRLFDAGKKLEVVDVFRARDGSWKDVGRFVLSRAGA